MLARSNDELRATGQLKYTEVVIQWQLFRYYFGTSELIILFYSSIFPISLRLVNIIANVQISEIALKVFGISSLDIL